MSELPEKIKLGYREWSIEKWPTADAIRAGRRAETDFLHNTIRVCEHWGKSCTKESLVHEIAHIIWERFHIDEVSTENRSEEYIVCCFGTGFLEVLVDNPKLMDYIKS